jgi:hypothetical protein
MYNVFKRENLRTNEENKVQDTIIKALEGDSIGTELENNRALNELLKKTNLMVANQRTDKLNMLL